VPSNDVLEEARIAMSERLQPGKNVAIVLVEYNLSLLSEREEVLQELGRPVISALGMGEIQTTRGAGGHPGRAFRDVQFGVEAALVAR
jgi:hypothetical protein